jgi:RNA polymerase sigma-70 factor (ECF subfamily)
LKVQLQIAFTKFDGSADKKVAQDLMQPLLDGSGLNKYRMMTANFEDEAEIILLAQTGDQHAFEMLVHHNAQYVFNLALRVLQDQSEAEEIAQEAFIKVWKALPRYRVEAKFRTWLYRIVVNLCYDRLPKLKRDFNALDSAATLDDEPAPNPGPEHILISNEQRSDLHQAIDSMPEAYRLLVTLRHLQEMSYAEIAEVTGQPLGTVKSGIHRARAILKERIDEHEARR